MRNFKQTMQVVVLVVTTSFILTSCEKPEDTLITQEINITIQEGDDPDITVTSNSSSDSDSENYEIHLSLHKIQETTTSNTTTHKDNRIIAHFNGIDTDEIKNIVFNEIRVFKNDSLYTTITDNEIDEIQCNNHGKTMKSKPGSQSIDDISHIKIVGGYMITYSDEKLYFHQNRRDVSEIYGECQ